MAKRINMPIPILKGKYSSGDPSLVPDGYCLQCRNVVVRPLRLETRPPFVYDNLMTIRGLANYDDQTNKVSRMLAINSTPNLFEKATSGDTWSASLGSVGGTRFTDGTNYYNIAAKAWTVFDVANNAEIADFIFNPNTRKMYFAVGGQGLARVDWAASPAQDTVESTLTNYSVTKDIVTRPVQLFAQRQATQTDDAGSYHFATAARFDALIDDVGVYHIATASQTGQTLTAYASFDKGVTYPYSDQVTLDTTGERNPNHLFETAPSVTIKLSHVGNAGATVWAVSKLDVVARVLAGEWPQTRPTPGAASL